MELYLNFNNHEGIWVEADAAWGADGTNVTVTERLLFYGVA